MLKRHIEAMAFSPVFGRQMRFILGPRQSGKTTLAKAFLEEQHCAQLYYNWDDREIRKRYLADNHFFANDIRQSKPKTAKTWLGFDEIHKYPKWKNVLKDIFDAYGEELGFIITGSAKLDMLRRSGDSLAGRYFNFRLNPVILEELKRQTYQEPPEDAHDWVENKLSIIHYADKEMEQLLEFSGFPEPLLQGNKRFHNKWGKDYLDRLIREDLRDMTRILELENIARLMELLPARVGSPLSIHSLSRDLGCSFNSVSGYIRAMELGYVVFRIQPYSKKIARSLTKESKTYFYDWTRISDPAKRFENYVAMELKVRADLWTDSGLGEFDLKYIRTRDGKETDFLITRDNNPWLLMEVKNSRSSIEYHHRKNRESLGKKLPLVQVVRETKIAEKREPFIYQISASRLF